MRSASRSAVIYINDHPHVREWFGGMQFVALLLNKLIGGEQGALEAITPIKRRLRPDCGHELFRPDRSRIPKAGPYDRRHCVAAGVRRALRP